MKRVILTASDSQHFLFLFSSILYLKKYYIDHPEICICDLGLKDYQLKILSKIKNLKVILPASTLPHYYVNWTWKIHLLANLEQVICLYLDLPNIKILSSLDFLYELIEKDGSFFVINNGQSLADIVPYEYFKPFGLDYKNSMNNVTFSSGIMGFNLSNKDVK